LGNGTIGLGHDTGYCCCCVVAGLTIKVVVPLYYIVCPCEVAAHAAFDGVFVGWDKSVSVVTLVACLLLVVSLILTVLLM